MISLNSAFSRSSWHPHTAVSWVHLLSYLSHRSSELQEGIPLSPPSLVRLGTSIHEPLSPLTSVVLSWTQFCPRGHSATSETFLIVRIGRWCCWQPLGRDQRHCPQPYYRAQNTPLQLRNAQPQMSIVSRLRNPGLHKSTD